MNDYKNLIEVYKANLEDSELYIKTHEELSL